MASPITYKRLVLSGDKAKATADEVKTKMDKDWKKDFPDGTLDIKSGVEGKMVIDVKTKESSAASLASKIKDIATRNKVDVVTKDKPTLSLAPKEKIGPEDLSPEELEAAQKRLGLKGKEKEEDSGESNIEKIKQSFKSIGDTIKSIYEDELVDKIKKSLMYQVGNPKGEPMSKGQKLPANTKMKKSELKEIIKNFNK